MRVNLNNLNYGIKCSVKILRFVKIYIYYYITRSIFKNKEKYLRNITHTYLYDTYVCVRLVS